MTGIFDFDIIRWLMGGDDPNRERRGAAPRGEERATRLGPGARRVRFEGAVSITQGMHTVRAKTGDLSEGGAFIYTNNPPGVGCEVLLSIRLSDGMDLVTTAQVRWMDIDDRCQPTGCGVAFKPLSDETRSAVRLMLDEAEARENRLPKPRRREARTELLWRAHGFLDRIAG